MDDRELLRRVRELVASCQWMNDGRGLLVPPSLAERLRENGVTEGYTAQEQIEMGSTQS